ncbi:MAG: DUF485 domain-containing protein [Thermoleophilaceae bacterium]
MPDEQERVSEPRGVTAGPDHHPEIDWIAAEQSPEFRELIRKRRAFVLPATIFFLVWYFGFIILAGYAEDFMGESIYEGFTVGYLLAMTQFIMVWGLGWAYLRKADRDFDPLASKAAETALEAGRRGRVEGEPPAGSEPPADSGTGREQVRPS